MSPNPATCTYSMRTAPPSVDIVQRCILNAGQASIRQTSDNHAALALMPQYTCEMTLLAQEAKWSSLCDPMLHDKTTTAFLPSLWANEALLYLNHESVGCLSGLTIFKGFQNPVQSSFMSASTRLCAATLRLLVKVQSADLFRHFRQKHKSHLTSAPSFADNIRNRRRGSEVRRSWLCTQCTRSRPH